MYGKQQIDKNEVKRVASDLIKTNGGTSSLEVKEQLRRENFEARQSEVSAYLQEVAREEGYNTEQRNNTSGNVYNYYTAPTATAAPSATAAPAAQTADPGILKTVLSSIYNIFGYRANENDKFETGQVTSQSDMTDLINDLAPQFNLQPGDFDSEFDPGAVIIWREKTPVDLALFVGNLTNVAPPAATVQPTVQPQNNTASKIAQCQTKTRKPYTRVNASPLFIATPATTIDDIRNGYDKNAWVLYSTSGTDKMVYDGKYTRDQVRSAYATKVGVHMKFTRSRRIGNIESGVSYKHLN